VNSPLLLELPPCGQVQVAKIRDVALASRALIHSRDGETLFSCIPICIVYLKKILLELICWIF